MNKSLRTLVMGLLFLCGMAAAHAAEEGLTVSQMTYDSKTHKWVVNIGLENPINTYIAYQCDMAFPEGVTYVGHRVNSQRIPRVEDEESGDMLPTHSLLSNVLPNGTLRMVVSSLRNEHILGTTGTLYTIRFNDRGTLDKSKSYDVNLTNIELVYRDQTDTKNLKNRQQGLINNPSLRCFDAMCNNASIYGLISEKELEWMNNFLLHNDHVTSVDVTHCTNLELGTLYVKNPNAVIYSNKVNQIGSNRNIVYNGECSELILSDKLPFHPVHPFTVKGASFTTTLTDAGYATVVLPFSCPVPQGLEAYRLTSVDDVDQVIKGEYVHGIEAHQPVLLRGRKGEYTFTGTLQTITESPAVLENNLLIGTYQPVVVAPGNYILQKHGTEVAFYRVAENTTPGMKPFRAYLSDKQTEGQWLTLSLDTPTGVEEVQVNGNDLNGIYNLKGQRMERTESGVNILKQKNGQSRKIIIK